MSVGTAEPRRYRVFYTERVRQRLRELSAVARERGHAEAYLSALREFDRRLHIYPQFGDPLIDLQVHTGQVRLGSVPPLTMRYAVYEERRMVLVAALPVLLPRRLAE